MKRIAFKVIHRSGRSAIIKKGIFCQQYEVGRKTDKQAGSMGIFCFETLKQAKYYMRFSKKHKVVKVRMLGEIRKPKFIAHVLVDRNVRDFYRWCRKHDIDPFVKMPRKIRLHEYWTDQLATYSLPNGTILCDAVEVLREVE